MTRYEFHCDSHVLELQTDDARVFIDLADLGGLSLVDEDRGDTRSSLPVYVEWEDVRDLFASYGCLERCPVGEWDGE